MHPPQNPWLAVLTTALEHEPNSDTTMKRRHRWGSCMRWPCQVLDLHGGAARAVLIVHGCKLLCTEQQIDSAHTQCILEGFVPVRSAPCVTIHSQDAHDHLLLAAYGELCAPEPFTAPQRAAEHAN